MRNLRSTSKVNQSQLFGNTLICNEEQQAGRHDVCESMRNNVLITDLNIDQNNLYYGETKFSAYLYKPTPNTQTLTGGKKELRLHI